MASILVQQPQSSPARCACTARTSGLRQFPGRSLSADCCNSTPPFTLAPTTGAESPSCLMRDQASPTDFQETRNERSTNANACGQRHQRRSPPRRPRGPHQHAGGRPLQLAGHLRVGQRHPRALHHSWLLWPRRGAEAPHRPPHRERSPRTVRLGGPRCDAGGDRACRAGRLPHRRHRRRGPEPQHPAPLGEGHPGGRHGPAGHPGHRQRGAQRLRRGEGDLRHRRRRHPRGDRSPGGAVAEAFGGVRHPHQSDRRVGRGGMKPAAYSVARPVAGKVDVVIVGAGHSGLAMSHCLARRGIDHVVLERGEVANAWRHERWDSLRLLTPNWLTRLPGMAYDGSDPDGYMRREEVVAFIARYARVNAAPVRTGTTVTTVTQDGAGYRVDTDRGRWQCRALVVASGAFSRPCVPRLGAALPAGIAQVTPHQYRNPGQIEEGGVLVVGASATGLQLADELQRAGRAVTLAVGEHVRMPRVYRGRDIQWWMHASGLLDARFDAQDDLNRARGVASPQLAGSRERAIFDLNALTAAGDGAPIPLTSAASHEITPTVARDGTIYYASIT